MKRVGATGRLARAGVMLFTMVATIPALAADATDDFRILYFEPLAPFPINTGPSQLKTSDDPLLPGLSFEAYGRRFELALEHNAKLTQDPTATAVAYRGAVVQQDGSWARLTRVGDELHGMIWDGGDLYIIEPVSDAREFMVAPLDPAQKGNVIYRLRDTLADLGPDFCSAMDLPPANATDGLATFKALTSDLKTRTVLQRAPGATFSLRLSAVGDASLRQRYASDEEATNAILVRLNNVDGIFSAQLGVEIQVSGISIYGSANNPFTNTTSADALLDQLGLLRSNTPRLRTDGLTHLFTGKDLDGNVVGLGYIDMLCRTRYGAALTESRGRGEAMETLIAAHEIGHNFGAIHDNFSTCSETPANEFIMTSSFPADGPEIRSFSQCSLAAMSQSLAGAACVVALPPADTTVNFSALPPDLKYGQDFEWSAVVANIGVQQATDVNVSLALPASLTVEDVTVAGGSCTSGGGTVLCALGQLPGGESRSVDLRLRATASGSFPITASTTATIDSNLNNNSASTTLLIDTSAPPIIDTSAPPSGGSPPTTVPVAIDGAAGGKGGGGSIEGLLLVCLNLLAWGRHRRVTR